MVKNTLKTVLPKFLAIILLHKTWFIFCFVYGVTNKFTSALSWQAIDTGLYQFDTIAYLDVAKRWYHPEANVQVYPLYPALIAIAHKLVDHYLLSAMLVSQFFSFMACYYFYKLARQYLDQSGSLVALASFLFFPTSYFLNIAYTETLFATFSFAAAYYWVQSKSWQSAAMIFFACLSRIFGVALILALLCDLIWKLFVKKTHSKAEISHSLIPIAAGCLAYGLYLFINYHYFGNALYFLGHQANHWNITPALPFTGFSFLLERSQYSLVHKYWLATNAIAIALPLIICIWTIRVFKSPLLTAYCICYWLLMAIPSIYTAQIRYVLLCFPVFICFGYWFRHHYLWFGLYCCLNMYACLKLVRNFSMGRWAY